MTDKMKVAIGIGANLSDRLSMLKSASGLVATELLLNAVSSSVYETAPWGFEDQPRFFNAVIVGECEKTVRQTFDWLWRSEEKLGRFPSFRFGPRVIDLDLLAYGQEVESSEGLQVPHPRLQERDFVLLPFNEVWPDWRHPLLGKTISELWDDLSRTRPSDATVVAPPLLGKASR